MATEMKLAVFTVVTPCILVDTAREFRGVWVLHVRAAALIMEAVSTSETSVGIYCTTRRKILENGHLRIKYTFYMCYFHGTFVVWYELLWPTLNYSPCLTQIKYPGYTSLSYLSVECVLNDICCMAGWLWIANLAGCCTTNLNMPTILPFTWRSLWISRNIRHIYCVVGFKPNVVECESEMPVATPRHFQLYFVSLFLQTC
jgi:hypothetical protein